VSLGFYLLAGQTSAGSFMSHWIVGGAFVAQFCAIFYIYYLFYFYLPLILTENEGAFSSLKKSAVLVWRNWWRTCVVQILPWACYLIFLVIVREAFKLNLHIYFIDNYSPTIGITCLQILLFALFIPWPAATLLVQLRDLELRKNF
jgi:hypothetical protein